MRTLLALLFLVLQTHAASAREAPAFAELRDRFEREVLAAEGAYVGDPDGLRRAAFEIAGRTYGGNWDAVRTEARRTLLDLPEIDLAAYTRDQPDADVFPREALAEIAPHLTPPGLAAMRFWDAESVAFFVASVAVQPDMSDSPAVLGLRLALVPTRAYRARHEGRDLLAARYMRNLVVFPYAITTEGMILPEFAAVRVYALPR